MFGTSPTAKRLMCTELAARLKVYGYSRAKWDALAVRMRKTPSLHYKGIDCLN